jgi:general stress protein 26
MNEITKPSDTHEKIWGLIKDIHIAMLTTTDTNGSLYSRPMATSQKEFAGELYFLTSVHSGKVEEIRDSAEVNLTYVDTHKSTFVSLTGTASVSRDKARIHELWQPSFKAWFAEGEGDPEISVLTVHVDEAEYWDAPASSLVRNIRILKRAIAGGAGKVGEHEHLSVASKSL